MFHPAKEDLERDPSAAVWNMLKFQTTPEGRFWVAIASLSLRLEHVMFQTHMSGPDPSGYVSCASGGGRRLGRGAPGWKRSRSGPDERRTDARRPPKQTAGPKVKT
jgi:hypothetical protein